MWGLLMVVYLGSGPVSLVSILKVKSKLEVHHAIVALKTNLPSLDVAIAFYAFIAIGIAGEAESCLRSWQPIT